MLREISNTIYNDLEKAVDKLKQYVLEHGSFIDLQNDECDTIYGFIWEGLYLDTWVEKQAKAIFIYNNTLFVCLDDLSINYSKDDVMQQDEYWYPLEGLTSDVLYTELLLNLLECIEEYESSN